MCIRDSRWSVTTAQPNLGGHHGMTRAATTTSVAFPRRAGPAADWAGGPSLSESAACVAVPGREGQRTLQAISHPGGTVSSASSLARAARLPLCGGVDIYYINVQGSSP